MSIEQIRSSPKTCVDVVALMSLKSPDLLIELLGEIDARDFKVICAAIPAKETNILRIKFNEQHYGMVEWEDAPQNKGVHGDVFIFWDCASNLFTFHKIHYVLKTTERNILRMSGSYMTLTYDQMVAYGAKPKRSNSYYPKKGFEHGSELMRMI